MYLQFALAARSVSRGADLAAAERDLVTALDIYQKLQDAGTFAASDMNIVDSARALLKKVQSVKTGK